MTIAIELRARHLLAAAAIVAVGVIVGLWAPAAHSQTASPAPVDTYAFLARSDNPVDALAASSVAGQLGGPVYLTPPTALDEHARQGLSATNPKVVVLAGGNAALSPAVEDQVRKLLPNATIRRFSGAGRTETARLINELTGQLGITRPVVAGATITGDVGIDGTLTLSGTDITATITALQAEVAALKALLAGVSRETMDGRDTLRFSGMNVQVVNGTGKTDEANGLGNVVVGYNAPPGEGGVDVGRAGSHYVIVGDQHYWTGFGGLVAGYRNRADGAWASVTGGQTNLASGHASSVSGGVMNVASTAWASVSGGLGNTASTSSAPSISGGRFNTASGNYASVSGGENNTASGFNASILGGNTKTVSGNSACHPSCV